MASCVRAYNNATENQGCICQISAGGSESWVSVGAMTQCCIETISNRQEASSEELKLTPLLFIYAGGQSFLVGGQTPTPGKYSFAKNTAINRLVSFLRYARHSLIRLDTFFSAKCISINIQFLDKIGLYDDTQRSTRDRAYTAFRKASYDIS